MPFKGAAQQSHRSPRKRAVEIGTVEGGFESGPAYDPQSGIPEGTGTPASEYEDPGKTKGGSTAPVKEKSPFKLKE